MAKKAMKSMRKKAMKKSARSYKTAAGARAAVLRGAIMKTKGGLKKDALTKSKSGKIVSKKASAAGKKAFKRLAKWNAAVKAARKSMGIKGFQAVGGKSA